MFAGVSRFEIYTLVAMIFYAVVAWGIVSWITLDRNNEKIYNLSSYD